MKQSKFERIYDGALMCGTAGCGCGCPVVDRSEDGRLFIWDPAKPENGKFYFSNDGEYNALIQNAEPIV